MNQRNTRRSFTQSVMLNSFQHLHLNQTLNKKEEILNQVQDDNIDRTTRAFTLIELLIVVLIIGILAAVAVPQYQKATKNAQYARMFSALQSAVKAQQVYYLTNGEYATSFAQLDIDFPPMPAKGRCDRFFSTDVVKQIGDFCLIMTADPARSIRVQRAPAGYNPVSTNGYQYFFENVQIATMKNLKAKNYYCIEARDNASPDKHCTGNKQADTA